MSSEFLASKHRDDVSEIAGDPALRIYGMMLALLHVLSFLHWELAHPVVDLLDPAFGPAVCWPFFEECQEWRILSRPGVQALLWGYLACAVVTVALFASPRRVRGAWWALLGLVLLNAVILFQDYRLRLNQHYMTYWVTLTFLFVPGKRRAVPWLVAAFYFWAGTLKFTPEWISGAALYGARPLGVPERLVPASCVYVILLELVVVFGLFARNPWIFWGTMLQFVAFHVASWPIVSFFYPTLMFAILSIFPLVRHVPAPTPVSGPEAPSATRRIPRGERGMACAVVAAFSLLQIVPFAYPGDRSLTGEGRLFALHMFDAPLECEAWADVRDAQGRTQKVVLSAKLMPRRIRCDPAVHFSLGRDVCRRLTTARVDGTVHLHLRTRRSGEQAFRTMIDQPDFCGADLHYDLWRSNAWILK